MFKFILIIILFIFLIIIIKLFFFKIKINFNFKTVKYKIKNISFLEKHKTPINLNKLNIGDLFYTTIPWNTTNFNYILFNDRYYIIEPGYYYYFIGEMVIKNNILVNKINKDILN